MAPKNPQFSDEAHRVAKLALDIWNSEPEDRKGNGQLPGHSSVFTAIRLLSRCETELRAFSAVSSHQRLEQGRTPFDELLSQDKQENLQKDETRILGRITKKAKLEAKIREVFPSREVFTTIDKFLRFQEGDASPIFRDMPAPDMARRALERCGELEKEPFALDSLSRYVRQCREGFVPDEVKRYPFADEPGSEMYGLFRSSEDICAAGWFSEWEKILICKACHTSRPPQEKK